MSSLIPLLLAGMYVGWNIGANDAGNCIGTSVGSGLLTFRRAALLVGSFAMLGAVLQGDRVMETVGKGIVTSELSVLAITIAMACAGLFVTAATFFRLPVSTSQVIVGGIAGVGLAASARVDFSRVISIAEVWVICPILTGILAIVINFVVSRLLRRFGSNTFWQRLPGVLLVGSAAYVSFSLGANHVGTAMGAALGPLGELGIGPLGLGLLGGGAMAVGVLTFGRRVTGTVAGGITPLDPVSAFAAQLAAALATHYFSILGIPVSTSQAIVGAVLGVGLMHGIRTVRLRKIGEIAIGWVATPLAAGVFAFLAYRLVIWLF